MSKCLGPKKLKADISYQGLYNSSVSIQYDYKADLRELNVFNVSACDVLNYLDNYFVENIQIPDLTSVNFNKPLPIDNFSIVDFSQINYSKIEINPVLNTDDSQWRIKKPQFEFLIITDQPDMVFDAQRSINEIKYVLDFNQKLLTKEILETNYWDDGRYWDGALGWNSFDLIDSIQSHLNLVRFESATDVPEIMDQASKAAGKRLQDFYSSFVDTKDISSLKSVSDEFVPVDYFWRGLQLSFQDSWTVDSIESTQINLGTRFFDTQEPADLVSKSNIKRFRDFYSSFIDTKDISSLKSVSDEFEAEELASKNYGTIKQDTLSGFNDAKTIATGLLLQEQNSSKWDKGLYRDSGAVWNNLDYLDLASLSVKLRIDKNDSRLIFTKNNDQALIGTAKPFFDGQFLIDSARKQSNKGSYSDVLQSDLFDRQVGYSRLIYTDQTQFDYASKDFTYPSTIDSYSVADSFSFIINLYQEENKYYWDSELVWDAEANWNSLDLQDTITT